MIIILELDFIIIWQYLSCFGYVAMKEIKIYKKYNIYAIIFFSRVYEFWHMNMKKFYRFLANFIVKIWKFIY